MSTASIPPASIALSICDTVDTTAGSRWDGGPEWAGAAPARGASAGTADRHGRGSVSHLSIVACDRTGTERGQEWTSGTAIIDENGWVAASPGPDGVATAELDLTLARDKKLTALCDAFGDRRPEIYERLSTAYPG